MAGNLIDIQASLRGGNLMQTGDTYMFLGMADSLTADLGVDRPLVGALKMITGQSPLRGYLGAWPQPGLLAMVPNGPNSPPDAAGYSRSIAGLWKRTFAGFTVMSFHREVLEQVTPQLRFEPSPNPAQIRAHIEDLQGTNLARWANQQGYQHAAKMSQGNVRLLSLLSEQFRVPPAEALATAQRVLDAELLDPLGGKYELVAGSGGAGQWRSTQAGAGVPATYQFPALTWIRGVDLEGRLSEGQVVVHAELDMPLEIANSGKPSLPAPLPATPNGVKPNGAKPNGNGATGTAPKPAVPSAPRPGLIRSLLPTPAPPKPGPVAPPAPGPREF